MTLKHLNVFGAFQVAQMVKNQPAIHETQFDPWVGKILWRKEQLPTPVFLPGEFHGPRSLVGYSAWDRKGWTRLSERRKEEVCLT